MSAAETYTAVRDDGTAATMLERSHVNGTDLYYQAAGEGPPVVFLHGFGGNHLIWWQQIAHFAPEYRCIAPDQRMFGLSADAEGSGAAAFVDDLAALLDELGVETAAVVAQSMGGWTAASFATQFPDRVAALVLADTPGGLLPLEAREEGDEDGGESGEEDESDEDDQGVESRAYSEALAPEMAFLYDSISALNVHRPAEFEDIRPGLAELPADPEVISDADVPVLQIVGEDDVLTPPALIRRVNDLLGDARLEVVEGSGHSVYFERPAVFNRLVGEFVESEAGF